MNPGNARIGTGNARVHSFGRHVYSWAETAKIDAAIAANLKEFGYGG
jgi:hypothetical protein